MIDVKFPDGAMHSVAGQLVSIPSETGNWSDQRFKQIPINCDPLWQFVIEQDVWTAVPRQGSDVAIFAPRSTCWWEAIAQMNTGPDEEGHAEAA